MRVKTDDTPAAGAPVIWLYGSDSADSVTSVEFEVAVTFAAVPVTLPLIEGSVTVRLPSVPICMKGMTRGHLMPAFRR